MSKPLPIGIQDFRFVRNNNKYYVDKTEIIVPIVKYWGMVWRFTRPRRFGKSLNLSTLDAFFNLKYEGNT